MKKRFNRVTAMAVIWGVALGIGCAGTQKQEKVTNETSVSGTKNEPAWVTSCAGAFKDAGKDAFYGCGSASGISNISLQIQTADNRARADLAKTLDTYVASFFKDYMQSASVMSKTNKDKKGGLTEAQEEQFVSSITKEITEMTLYGVQVQDHFRSPVDSTLFSLVKVSFDNVSQSMEKQMRQRAKDVKMDANDALKELDDQLQKRRESGM
jgi:outer membrane murein-binding lipoprotein Lpp